MYIPHRNENSSPKIIIFTGAGVSAESGISTFRDSNGLWCNHKIDEVCNIHSWRKNYDLVHDFYNQRRVELKDKEPNMAHKIIKEIWEENKEDSYVITQNVDDLFERAGLPEVLHLHGFIPEIVCLKCGKVSNIGYVKVEKDYVCEDCEGKIIKPNIVFFYESAPMYSYLNRALEYCDDPNTIVIVSGTMGNVVPIDYALKNKKCIKILNNLERSPDINEKNYDYVFYEPATTAFHKIKEIVYKSFRN
jgi:NAD-dependent deacetylase